MPPGSRIRMWKRICGDSVPHAQTVDSPITQKPQIQFYNNINMMLTWCSNYYKCSVTMSHNVGSNNNGHLLQTSMTVHEQAVTCKCLIEARAVLNSGSAHKQQCCLADVKILDTHIMSIIVRVQPYWPAYLHTVVISLQPDIQTQMEWTCKERKGLDQQPFVRAQFKICLHQFIWL